MTGEKGKHPLDDAIARLSHAGKRYSTDRLDTLGLIDRAMRNNQLAASGRNYQLSAIANAAKRLDGLRHVSDAVSPMMKALEANNSKSRMISEQMRLAEQAATKTAAIAPREWSALKAVNPAARTNSLLESLTSEMSRVSELSAKQIDIQTQQVELIGQLVTAFSDGAVAQDKALVLAQRNMWIAIIAAVVGALIAILVPIVT